MSEADAKTKWLAEWQEANRLFEAGDQVGAEKHLANCALMSPEIWCGLGMEMLNNGEDMEGAMRRFQEAAALTTKPSTRAICLNNIGTVLANYGRRTEALDYFQQSLAIFPQYPDAYANIGLCHKWRGEPEPALEWTDRALAINPLHQQAAFTRSLILLLDGRMPEGWDEYEARWRMRDSKMRKLEIPWPEWDGKNAKRVLIYGEQGIGDNIQMMRYARVMRDSGMEVRFAIRDSLMSLAEHSGIFNGVHEFGAVLSAFDAHIPAFSLPRVFRTTAETIPLAEGYIKPPPLSDVMEYGPGLNVGIFWCGAKAYKQNIFRSTHLTQWREVLEVPGVTFHSLQVGDGESEALLFPQLKVYDPPADYLETARRMAGLDLVITIDTSVAHLAGAMGIPVWILIPKGNDFRWLLGRDDSPWYKSARLFRAPADFEWKPVFERIANELRSL